MTSPPSKRKERLAQALRENLKRRKARARTLESAGPNSDGRAGSLPASDRAAAETAKGPNPAPKSR